MPESRSESRRVSRFAQAHEIAKRTRHDRSVQIRKQRRDERLHRRRQTATTNQATAIITPDDLVRRLDAVLTQPHDEAALVQLQTDMAVSTLTTNVFLERLLQTDEVKARALISVVLQSIQQQQPSSLTQTTTTAYTASLALLLDLSSESTTSQNKTSPDDYYGSAPIRWSDLLLCDDLQHNHPTNLLATLLQQLLTTGSSKPATVEPPTTVGTLEIIAHILGNLVQDESSSSSSAVRTAVLEQWPAIVQQLPVTMYLCAATIRQDQQHYGMDFMRDLTPGHLVDIFQTSMLSSIPSNNNSMATEAAWIVEALSRREPEAIHVLCRHDDLMTCLIACLGQGLQQQGSSSNLSSSFAVPALQAIENLATANNGQYAGIFLESPLLVSSLSSTLMMQREKQPSASIVVVVEAIRVTGSLLEVALTKDGSLVHPAVTTLLPRLVHVLVSGTSVFEWKREAAWYLNVCIATFSRGAQATPEQELVQQVLWNQLDNNDARQLLLQALIDLLSSPDLDAATAAIRILDRLLRRVPASRELFATMRGSVDTLEQVCLDSRGDNDDDREIVANVAADLLDDFFDPKHEEESSLDMVAPVANANHFVFGPAAAPEQMAFDFSSSAPPPPGRGRGRTLPAWMKQSNA